MTTVPVLVIAVAVALIAMVSVLHLGFMADILILMFAVGMLAFVSVMHVGNSIKRIRQGKDEEATFLDGCVLRQLESF